MWVWVEEDYSMSLKRDAIIIGVSLLPGLAVAAVAACFNLGFVQAGWPLFTIFGLGLFAGTVTLLDQRR